jgi:hypothetical protein
MLFVSDSWSGLSIPKHGEHHTGWHFWGNPKSARNPKRKADSPSAKIPPAGWQPAKQQTISLRYIPRPEP